MTNADADPTLPERGATFNEAQRFPDEVTLRPTTRLTRHRRRNQMPTYHLNNGFSKDSRYLALMTYDERVGSAILRADVETGDLTVVDRTAPDDPAHFTEGNDMAMCMEAGLIVSKLGDDALVAYDVETLEKRILLADLEPGYHYGHPAGTADGKSILIGKHKLPKDETTHTVYLRIDLASGEVEEIFHDERSANVHILAHPTNPDLLLIDRNYAPLFSAGSDRGQTTRVWILDLRRGALTEVRPRDPNRFQIHSNWSFNGRYIYYHGQSGAEDQRPREEKRGLRYDFTDRAWLRDGSRGVDHYLGVADLQGEVVWEARFPYFHYGHASSHSTEPAFITDGLITPDLITAIYWQDRNTLDLPRIEIMGRHGTYWKQGQHFDPHCLMSPDGRWLSYNRGYRDGRSDVYLLQLEA